MNVTASDIRLRLARAACLFVLSLTALSARAWEMEMGAVTVQDTFTVPAWTQVSFARPFSVRPIVIVLPTNDGGDPATLRVRNVTTTGFEVLQVEPDANDGPHVAMSTAYLAVEPGVHTLPDGSTLTATLHTTSSFANRFISTTWDTIVLPTPFASTPAVLAQIQTVRNEAQNPPAESSVPWLEAGIRNVGATSLQVTLERAESVAGSVTQTEDIGIVAVDAGLDVSFVDFFGSAVRLQSILTPRNVAGWDNGCFTNSFGSPFGSTPLVVASQNSRNGSNGGWVRRCSQSAGAVGLTVDEDIDTDSERAHTTESAGIFGASVAFHVNFGVDLNVSKNVSAFADPVNGSVNPFSIPGADMRYVIAVENDGAGSPDNDSLTITDPVPTNMRLCVTSACLAGGPAIFDDATSPVPTGVTLQAIAYSNNGGLSFDYVPMPDGEGFDAAVDAIRISLQGQFAPRSTSGAPRFTITLAARLD